MGTSDVRILDERTPEQRDRPFLPGAGRTWLLPLYDVLTRAAGVHTLHQRASELADVAPEQEVLDVGCGTGNLALTLLAAQPAARVTGLDPDRAALRRAARKARRRGVPLTLLQGYADRLPTDDASLDHVVSSLALHHLDDDSRVAFAHEALRALRPGGTITIVDFGGAGDGADDAHQAHSHGPAHALQHLPRLLLPRRAQRPTLTANVGHGIVDLLARAGFSGPREVGHLDHRFGRVSFVQAARPSSVPGRS